MRNRRYRKFPVLNLKRDDIETLGFYARYVDDATMEKVARKLQRDIYHNLYWDSLLAIVQDLKLPKLTFRDSQATDIEKDLVR